MTSIKKIYIDTETTGVDPKANGIIQLAGIIELGEQKMESFNYKVKPFPGDIILDSALVVSGNTRKGIEDFEPPGLVFHKFLRLLDSYVDKFNKRDKFHFIGYNSRFDDSFLREWFNKNNADKYAYGSRFWWPSIDVSNMAAVELMKYRKEFPDFKLMTVASRCIETDKGKAHDALYDVEITRQLYKHLKKRGAQ